MLNCAKEIYNEKGIKGISVSEIVKKCNISNRTFYNIFSTKKEFMSMLLEYYPDINLQDLEKKKHIILKSIDIFSKYDYNEIDMNMIAAAANMNRSTLYKFFHNKLEILEYTIKFQIQEFKEKVIKESALITDPIDCLEYFTNFTYTYAKLHQDSLLLGGSRYFGIKSKNINQYIKDLIEFSMAKVSQVIELGKEQGKFKKDIDTTLFSRSFITFLWGYCVCFDVNTENEFISVKKAFLETIIKEIIHST